MPRRTAPTWTFCIAGVVIALVLALLAFCASHHVWSYDEWLVYNCMESECHPVWREFLDERIQVGDDVEAVIARTHPSQVFRRGREVELVYYAHYNPDAKVIHFTSVTAHARDGKLVSAYAASCTWIRQFFDVTEDAAGSPETPYRQVLGGGAIWVANL